MNTNEHDQVQMDRSAYSEAQLKKLDAACTAGQTWCTNGKVHKCNSKGKWYATGEACVSDD